jgi:hypothetical protein
VNTISAPVDVQAYSSLLALDGTMVNLGARVGGTCSGWYGSARPVARAA